MSFRTVAEVAAELQVREWTVAELVRKHKVDCLRVGTTDAQIGAIRFTEDQFEQLVDLLTVKAQGDVRPRRRRRAS